jgi:hypothetical protein
MWCCRRIEVLSWADCLENEDVLQRIAENKDNLQTIKNKKPNWTRHQFTTIYQPNEQNFFLDIYVTKSTEYFCMFHPPGATVKESIQSNTVQSQSCAQLTWCKELNI